MCGQDSTRQSRRIGVECVITRLIFSAENPEKTFDKALRPVSRSRLGFFSGYWASHFPLAPMHNLTAISAEQVINGEGAKQEYPLSVQSMIERLGVEKLKLLGDLRRLLSPTQVGLERSNNT